MKTDFSDEFKLSDTVIYLNHAGVAPWPTRTASAVQRFAEENIRQGALDYPAWLAREDLLREQFKALINAPSVDDIALVKNTSEALSFVAMGLNWQAGDNIVSSDEEFPSNRLPWQALAERGVKLRQARLNASDDPEEALLSLVDERTRLLTISSIQFASGLRIDLERLGAFCRRHQILFCIDAIQSLGAVCVDAQACHADFIMADGHKWMLGPEGIGLFYSTPQARAQLDVSQYGWHMIEQLNNYDNLPWRIAINARRFECGSMNMLGIHALSASLSLLLEIGAETIENLILSHTAYLMEGINQCEDLCLLSPELQRLRSGIVLFRHQRIANEHLYAHLRSQGVICAQRGAGIRFSPHFYNSEAQLAKALDIVLACPPD